MGKSTHHVCAHAHAFKYSNTAAAGRGVERGDILRTWGPSMKVTLLRLAVWYKDAWKTTDRDGGWRRVCQVALLQLDYCESSHTLISPAGFTSMPRKMEGWQALRFLNTPYLSSSFSFHPPVCHANGHTAWACVGHDLWPLTAVPSPSLLSTSWPENSPAMRGPPG